MINCPNCGAPWNPYSYRCEYCGTYAFDTTAWDLDENTPCYVTFKTRHGVITALARPMVAEVEVSSDTVDAVDPSGYKIRSFVRSKQANINVSFQCLQNTQDRTLFVMRCEDD